MSVKNSFIIDIISILNKKDLLVHLGEEFRSFQHCFEFQCWFDSEYLELLSWISFLIHFAVLS